LSNAGKACRDNADSEQKRIEISLRIERQGPGMISLSVTDTGVGIAAENIEKIFQHGFTTRKDGHGFGLHSAANDARAMGGELTVSSPGLGKGARFELQIPLMVPSEQLQAGAA
jgi:two-component system, NtrC family, sensor kinase